MITPAVATAFLLQAAPAGGGSLMPLAIQIVLIVGIFYFLMIRPQQKQRQRHEAALKALKRGDEVVTTGGVIAEVIHIKEAAKEGNPKGLDDRITIKSGEARLVVERRSIGRILTAAGAASSSNQAASSSE